MRTLFVTLAWFGCQQAESVGIEAQVVLADAPLEQWCDALGRNGASCPAVQLQHPTGSCIEDGVLVTYENVVGSHVHFFEAETHVATVITSDVIRPPQDIVFYGSIIQCWLDEPL